MQITQILINLLIWIRDKHPNYNVNSLELVPDQGGNYCYLLKLYNWNTHHQVSGLIYLGADSYLKSLDNLERFF